MPSNYSASFTSNLTYTGSSGSTVTPPTKTVNAVYRALSDGIIDVPDALASATVLTVPFGAIAVDATGGEIENQTGQPLEVRVNGSSGVNWTIPSGGLFRWANPTTSSGSAPILSMTLKTTAIQVGAGQINYTLFGDPATS